VLTPSFRATWAAVIRDPAYAGFVFVMDADGSLAKAWGANALPTLVLVRPGSNPDQDLTVQYFSPHGESG